MGLLFFVLAIPFKGNFFTDILLPAGAMVFVGLLILNALLRHWGFTLW